MHVAKHLQDLENFGSPSQDSMTTSSQHLSLLLGVLYHSTLVDVFLMKT